LMSLCHCLNRNHSNCKHDLNFLILWLIGLDENLRLLFDIIGQIFIENLGMTPTHR